MVIKDRQQNLHDIKIQKEAVSKQIHEKRAEINKYLENMEQAILEKLEDIEIDNRKQIEDLIQETEIVQRQTEECRRNTYLIRKHASNTQTYIGTRKLQEQVEHSERYVHSLESNGSLKYTSIALKVNDQLNCITKEIVTFGDVNITKSSSKISLSWQGQKAAQMCAPIYQKPHIIDNINMKMVQKIKTGHRYEIPDCLVMENKYLVFTTNPRSSSVLKYDFNGALVSATNIMDQRRLKLRRHKKHMNCTYRIVPKDEKTIIVTQGGIEKNLLEMDIDTLHTTQRINTCDYLYGSTFHNGALISCTLYNGIKRFSLSNGNITREEELVKVDASDTYITADANFLYFSDHKTDSVLCFDFEGKAVWLYKDSMLRAPRGITVDSKSNIYVTGSQSNNVVVISADGKHSKQLLGSTDSLVDPCAIYYDKASDHLLVSNYTGPAFLYKIT